MKKYLINKNEIEIDILNQTKERVQFVLNGKEYQFSLLDRFNETMILNDGAKNYRLSQAQGYARFKGVQYHLEKKQLKRGASSSDDGGNLLSPMPGKILKIAVTAGDEVQKGTILVIMEAMKMEHALKAPCDCVIDQVFYKEGDQVEGDIELVSITPHEASS